MSFEDQAGNYNSCLSNLFSINNYIMFSTDDILVCVLVLLVVLAVIIGIVVGALAGPPSERPLRLGKFITTQTTCGLVEG